MKIITLLLISNLLTLCLLIAISNHYQIPSKLYQIVFKEGRVPFLSASHEMNRNYAASRQLFNSYSNEGIKSLVLGDSQISKVNWNELLSGLEAVGRGIDGDTVTGLAKRIADYRDIQPEVCIILIGTNDVWKNRPLSETEEAYQALIINALKIWPETNLILISVPPFASWVTDSEANNIRVSKTNHIISNLAEQSSRTQYLNLHDSILDSNDHLAQEMTMDGVHLNAKAYAVLRNKLFTTMQY